MIPSGKFIISLDFELYWGVRDKRTLADYGHHIEQVWDIIPRLLEMFKKYDVSATFATVGFLFASDAQELLKYFPEITPEYLDTNLSPYLPDIRKINKYDYIYYFAPSLIDMIRSYPGHEIGTHTFSHYYCLESGQTPDQFDEDLKAAVRLAESQDIELKSIVFPRNQYNDTYIGICKMNGIDSYRGNENSWIYKSASGKDDHILKRAFRLIDAYVNISGHHTYKPDSGKQNNIINLPASRFLRPFSSKMKVLEPLKLRRIRKSMTYAAKNKEVYHLWWHPHNFGSHTDQNFEMLESILEHFRKLNNIYGFESMTMTECAENFLTSK